MNPTNPLRVSEHNLSPLRRFSRGDGMKQRRPVAYLILAPIFVLLICFAFSIPATAQAHFTRVQHSYQASFANGICYQAHVQNIGWQSPVCNGQVAGTTGQSLRMEAISIWLVNSTCQDTVLYLANVQNIGWQYPWRYNGQVAGTTGQSLRMEAIEMMLCY